MMVELDRDYPQYGFAAHKGYCGAGAPGGAVGLRAVARPPADLPAASSPAWRPLLMAAPARAGRPDRREVRLPRQDRAGDPRVPEAARGKPERHQHAEPDRRPLRPHPAHRRGRRLLHADRRAVLDGRLLRQGDRDLQEDHQARPDAAGGLREARRALPPAGAGQRGAHPVPGARRLLPEARQRGVGDRHLPEDGGPGAEQPDATTSSSPRSTSQQQLIEKAMNEYRVIAEMMIAHGRSQDAAQVYERALDIDSSNIGFINDAVFKLKESGNAAAASRFLAIATERNPQAARIGRLARGDDEPEAPAPPACAGTRCRGAAAGRARPAAASAAARSRAAGAAPAATAPSRAGARDPLRRQLSDQEDWDEAELAAALRAAAAATAPPVPEAPAAGAGGARDRDRARPRRGLRPRHGRRRRAGEPGQAAAGHAAGAGSRLGSAWTPRRRDGRRRAGPARPRIRPIRRPVEVELDLGELGDLPHRPLRGGPAPRGRGHPAGARGARRCRRSILGSWAVEQELPPLELEPRCPRRPGAVPPEPRARRRPARADGGGAPPAVGRGARRGPGQRGRGAGQVRPRGQGPGAPARGAADPAAATSAPMPP